MKKLALLLLLPLLFLTSCHDDEPERSRRTVLVYMAARNSLSSFYNADIREMQQAEVPADCRLLIFLSTYGEEPSMIEITPQGRKQLKLYTDNPISTDPATLRRAIADARLLAPSKEFGIVMWSHSTGWKGVKQAPASRSFGLDAGREMSIPDMADALATANADFLFFDSCFMGGVEVAYELRRCARWFVGSMTEVPADGMPYDLTTPELFNSDMAQGLVNAIDLNVDHYISDPTEKCPSTFTLVDLQQMDALADATRSLMQDARELPTDYEPQYLATSTTFKPWYVDMGAQMEALAASPESFQAWQEVMNRAVIHCRHTGSIWGQIPFTRCSGLSICPVPAAAPSYSELEWSDALN